jgi:hypothetical protein
MAKKKLDPKAKAKREKVIAAVAGVVLLGVLAFAVPMTMKQLKAQNATPAAATAPAAATTTTPTVATDLASASGSSVGVGLGQLDSFSRFDSKDPFTQQVDPRDLGGPTTSGGGSAPHGTGSVTPAAGSSSPPSSAGSSSPPAPRVAPPPPTAAVITVNGGPPQKVSVGQDFPLAPFDPLFHLVSLTRKAAKISVAGGSLADGKATVTLRKGHPLTLMNTADGTRYELRLLWLGSGVPPASILPPTSAAGSPSATTPAATTPPTGATATTTTP